jgi:hypothetical protein
MEVCISKRNSDDEGRSFIMQRLLNWGGKNPLDAKKPCVIKNKNWELAEGQGAAGYWRVEQDATDLDRPLPKEFKDAGTAPGGGGGTTTGPNVYWRYRITLEVPVGEGERKAAAAPKTPAPGPDNK